MYTTSSEYFCRPISNSNKNSKTKQESKIKTIEKFGSYPCTCPSNCEDGCSRKTCSKPDTPKHSL